MIMKTIFKYSWLYILLAPCVSSCDEYDLFDEIATIGKQAPHVIWELPSSSAVAGDSVSFRTQYYVTERPVKSLEVWYEVLENVNMSVSCPLVSTFTYNVAINEKNLVRQSMKMASYEHTQDLWNDELNAYLLNNRFPTSRTLRSFEWKSVTEFDMDKFNQLFPDTFIVSFRNNLYDRLQVADFRKVLVSTEKMTPAEFQSYIDYTIDLNSQDTIWNIKPEAVSVIKSKYEEIPFSELIYSNTDQVYKLEYEKIYQLDALFKVIDQDDIVGFSENRTIDLR